MAGPVLPSPQVSLGSPAFASTAAPRSPHDAPTVPLPPPPAPGPKANGAAKSPAEPQEAQQQGREGGLSGSEFPRHVGVVSPSFFPIVFHFNVKCITDGWLLFGVSNGVKAV